MTEDATQSDDESADDELAGGESVGGDSTGDESTGGESAGDELPDSESVGSESVGSESVGSESAGDESTPESGDGTENGESAEGVPVEEVHHVAELARVDLDDAEAASFASQFTDILGYFEALDEVPSVESDPELTNVMRADEQREGLSQSEALANAAETEAGYFKGPRVS